MPEIWLQPACVKVSGQMISPPAPLATASRREGRGVRQTEWGVGARPFLGNTKCGLAEWGWGVLAVLADSSQGQAHYPC